MSQRLPMPIGLQFVLEKWDEWLCPSLLCVSALRPRFPSLEPFPLFLYDLRAMAKVVCLCLLRLDAETTSATTSTALRSAFLFVSAQFPIFIEFAVSACASRPFLANAI